jgi:Uma2 family endonuclease
VEDGLALYLEDEGEKMALSRRSSMTVQEYFQLEQSNPETRYEFIDGHVTMLAGGTLNHATIAANVIITLGTLLRGSPCHVFTSDARVQLAEQRYVYPDASVSCDEQDRGESNVIRSPRLVVEVLSPGTEAYDRGRKFAYYRSCPSIQEYLLIDSQQHAVELYRREKQTFWTFQAFDSGDTVELTSIRVKFPVNALYDNVLFPTNGENPPA